MFFETLLFGTYMCGVFVAPLEVAGCFLHTLSGLILAEQTHRQDALPI